jgi:formylmethanofuran dehydrogenase subunit D
LQINCHSEKKTGILMTQSDMDKLNIKDGDTVSLTFRTK